MFADELTDRIKAIIAERGNRWTKRRDLLRRLGRGWLEVENTMTDLIEAEVIEAKKTKAKRGRPSEEYRLVF